MTLRIETKRLILRPLQLTDEDDLLEYQSHPDIVRYIPWPERTREQVRTAIEKILETGKFDLKEEGDYIVLGWELKDGPHKGKIIGQSNMSLISLNDKCSNIGWVTHQNFQSLGYAYEATRALMEHAFTHYPLHRIIADIDTRVPRSAGLAMKLGMRREATLIEGEFFKGEWCDMWLYAILRSEFQA